MWGNLGYRLLQLDLEIYLRVYMLAARALADDLADAVKSEALVSRYS